MPDPEPEVCIVWPLAIQYWKAEKPALPFMVDTAWPAVVHVCRDARAILLRSGLVRLRYSQLAGFDVPCREFNPCIDTLYWNRDQIEAMGIFFKEPENVDLMCSLRHIAIELPGIYPSLIPAPFLRTENTFPRTVAFVVPDTSEDYSFRDSFLPPARRFKLRDIPEDRLQNTTCRNVPYRTEDLCATQSLQQVIQACRKRLIDAMRPQTPNEEGVSWDLEDRNTGGLNIKVQSFVEYTAGEWVEVCGSRKLGQHGQAPQVRLIPPGDWKNPRDYRVLDDDCGRYPHAEELPRE